MPIARYAIDEFEMHVSRELLIHLNIIRELHHNLVYANYVKAYERMHTLPP